ncbi:MAG: UvrD-helicase domain-containing protein [Bacteroidota bacterium]
MTPQSFKIDYKQDLNAAQYEAVTSADGPFLIIAEPGTGKTRTIVYRVSYLIACGVNPDNLLLLTFTRKAAREMLRRAVILLGARCKNVAGGTFHSFANTSTPVDQLLAKDYPHYTEIIDDIKKVLDGYVRYKAGNNLIDYDDLLLNIVTLSKCNESLRAILSHRYRYIMVVIERM